MKKNGTILSYLRLREQGKLSEWPYNTFIVLSRPNYNEDYWFYN